MLDKKKEKILDVLNTPELLIKYKMRKKRALVQLEQFKDVVLLARKKGISYAGIAQLLEENAGVKVSPSSIRRYVQLKQQREQQKEQQQQKKYWREER